MKRRKALYIFAPAVAITGIIGGSLLSIDAPVRSDSYRVVGASLYAVGACIRTPGCVADIWAHEADGGIRRLQVRVLEDGGLRPLDGSADLTFEIDAGEGNLH